jgi:hypothetical protein
MRVGSGLRIYLRKKDTLIMQRTTAVVNQLQWLLMVMIDESCEMDALSFL